MNFTGEKCVCCGKVFEDGDDVVVCPECGSPHHRECYRKENRCANSAMHGTGEKWHKTVAEENKTEKKICPECGFPNNPSDFDNCVVCGADLDGKENIDSLTPEQEDINIRSNTGFNPDEDMGGATLKEVSMFVGTNTFYYIPIFKRMKDFGSKISFNFTCFLFPSFYFANRKMWFWAMISAIISVVFNLPLYVMAMAEQGIFTDGITSIIYENQYFIQELASICNWGSWLARVLMCIFANRIYFNFSMKKLRLIKKNTHGRVNPHMLVAFGGVKPMNIILITLITMSLSLLSMVGIIMLLNVMAVV
ncbi:MAG: DUF2628 domain-containing protein [Ruminococcus sp.]|nr:DUF2628 domain-containing protein [Ruminococcus sp.]